MSKKVSVIVPVYNAEKYLPRSLNSILNQNYKNLEIIIIDDCSTDDSVKIIKKYALKDDRIRPVYSKINNGVSKTRNIGLRTFSGDYVMFVDADDVLTKDCIEIMVDRLEKYDGDVVDSYHLVMYEDKGKKYYFTEGKLPKEDLVMGSLEDNIEVLDKATYITGKLIKKELLEGLYFDEELRRYEDMLFEHELKYRLKNMIFIKDVVYYYVQVSGSLINTLGEKHAAYLDAAKKVQEVYKKSSKKVKERIQALLVTNAFFTGITKVIKNDKSIVDNTKILMDYFNRFDEIFNKWQNNPKISKFVKKNVIKLRTNEKKAYKLVKKTRKKNFIKIYFKFMAFKNKYKGKSSEE